MLFRARAFRSLGLNEAAKEVLATALRRKKGRPTDLIKALRYERAMILEDLGKKAAARQELEKIYSEDPDYQDVAERLGLK